MPWIHFYYDKNWVDDKIIENSKKLLNHNDYKIKEYKWNKYSIINFVHNDKLNNEELSIKYKWFIICLDWYFHFKDTEYIEYKKNLKKFIDKFIKKWADCISDISSWKFNLLLFNTENHEINIFNDRFWLNNCYYYSDNCCFIFSPEIKWILPYLDKVWKKEINLKAIYDFMSFWFITWSKSYIKWVKMLKGASSLKIETKKLYLSNNSYWIPKFNQKPVKKNILLKRMKDVFEKNIKEYLCLSKNILCFLSWWYDSRLILANLEKETKNINTITFGDKKNKEVKIAKKITQKFDIKNKSIEFWENNINSLIWLTEWEEDISFDYIIEAGKYIKNEWVVFDWFLWDTIFWSLYFKHYYKNYKIIYDLLWIYNPLKWINYETLFLTHKFVDWSSLLQKKKLNDLKKIDKNFNLYIPEYVKNETYIENKIDLIKQANRWKRYINIGSSIYRKKKENILPFLNYEIYDLYLTIPIKFRLNHKIYNELYYKYYTEYNIWSTHMFWKITKFHTINIFKTYLYHMKNYFFSSKSYAEKNEITNNNDLKKLHLFKSYSWNKVIDDKITTIEKFVEIFIKNDFYNKDINKLMNR